MERLCYLAALARRNATRRASEPVGRLGAVRRDRKVRLEAIKTPGGIHVNPRSPARLGSFRARTRQTEVVARDFLMRRGRGRGRGYPHALLLFRGHGHRLRLAPDAEPVERVGDRKDAVRARVKPNVVVVGRTGVAGDGSLVCEFGEEVVEIGQRGGSKRGRGAWRSFRRGLVIRRRRR